MKKILVLDDEQDVEFIFNIMLEEEIDQKKIHLDYFSDPQTCLDSVFSEGRFEYDYVLTDINMPTISGVKFVEKIREKGYKGPVGLISAYQSEDYEEEMERLGVSNFFPKPIDFGKLKDALLH